MERLARLKSRVASLNDLRDLMSAMRALAATQVQAAQNTLNGIREYTGVIEDAIAAGVGLLPAEGWLNQPAPASGDMLILICSEHGFVGGFNDQLLSAAALLMAPDRQLAIIGQRGVDLASEHQLEPLWQEPMATHIGGVLGVARRVAGRRPGVHRAELVYAGYRRGGRYEVETRRVLPLDPTLLQRRQDRAPPLHHLPAEQLLVRLADEYLLAELTRALMESFASENGARLRVMEAADRNIDQRRTRLDGEIHSLRQASITAELLELMTGAEASSSGLESG